MAVKLSKVFINCAVTGAIHIPTMSDYLPITPQQIADEEHQSETGHRQIPSEKNSSPADIQ